MSKPSRSRVPFTHSCSLCVMCCTYSLLNSSKPLNAVLSHSVLTNSLLYDAVSRAPDRLQQSQEMQACVVMQSSSWTIAKPLLQSLHWLPVHEQIKFKVASLTFKARWMSQHTYTYCWTITSFYRPSNLLAHRTWSYQEHTLNTFSIATPIVWNRLPDDVVYSGSLFSFKKPFKSSPLSLYLYLTCSPSFSESAEPRHYVGSYCIVLCGIYLTFYF